MRAASFLRETQHYSPREPSQRSQQRLAADVAKPEDGHVSYLEFRIWGSEFHQPTLVSSNFA